VTRYRARLVAFRTLAKRIFLKFQQEIQRVDSGLAVERRLSIFENIAAGPIDEWNPGKR
jgi:hypothetical protein